MSKEDLLRGRVVANHLTKYIVEYNENRLTLEVSGRFKYIATGKDDYPVVGDYVLFHKTKHNNGIIEQIESRRNKLSRLGTKKTFGEQIIATNIDIVFLCISLNEDFNTKKLSNFLRLAHSDNFKTVILLTKKDLCNNSEHFLDEVRKFTEDEAYLVSIYEQADIDRIREIISKGTAIFIGSSGVGKSSIINKLLDTEYFKTNEIRISDAQGRHTTVHKELVHLANGGSIIDSPGIRIVNSYFLENIEDEFSEITKLSSGCKFSDCTHTNEPGCNVKKAVLSGELEEEELDQYFKTLRLNAYSKKQEMKKQRILEKRNRFKKVK